VLFRVPFTLATGAAAAAATTDIAGYGDWSGMTGDVSPSDGTIATDPGSGAGRLLVVNGAGGTGRVLVATEACPSLDCTTTAPPTPVAFTATAAASGTVVSLEVHQSNEAGQPVQSYEARYAITVPANMPLDPAVFTNWAAAGAITVGAPDTTTTLSIAGLTPQTDYAVGIRAHGVCATSEITYQRFRTPAPKFTKLSGCFVATAAFGSDLDPEVRTLRALRDAAADRSSLAAAAVDLYYRSSPPLASLIARSSTARAAVRTLIRATLGSSP
jgi:hypothetical protein